MFELCGTLFINVCPEWDTDRVFLFTEGSKLSEPINEEPEVAHSNQKKHPRGTALRGGL